MNSNTIILVIIFMIIVIGFIKKVNVFKCFQEGVKNTLGIIIDIFSFVLTFTFAITLLQKSGLIEAMLKKFYLNISPLLVIQSFIRPISANSSLSLLINIYNQYGPNSFEGILSSFIHCAVDSVIYMCGLYSCVVKINEKYFIKKGLIFYLISLLVCILLTYLYLMVIKI